MFSPALVHFAKSLACAPVIVLTLAVADSSLAAPLEKPELDSLVATFEARPPSTSPRSLRRPRKQMPLWGPALPLMIGRRSSMAMI